MGEATPLDGAAPVGGTGAVGGTASGGGGATADGWSAGAVLGGGACGAGDGRESWLTSAQASVPPAVAATAPTTVSTRPRERRRMEGAVRGSDGRSASQKEVCSGGGEVVAKKLPGSGSGSGSSAQRVVNGSLARCAASCRRDVSGGTSSESKEGFSEDKWHRRHGSGRVVSRAPSNKRGSMRDYMKFRTQTAPHGKPLSSPRFHQGRARRE
ncbi:hypothetical protein DZF91_22160 [Actinomadura logoneensis]|uniref:Uncharacterized protein n=1 Tax=Actinomadura logoneensis TaxID=2293572 RepID=A0A372JHM1_9ACTN|nr:hypothetical protein DZF91_22160 [Actinomadura logoneensis]